MGQEHVRNIALIQGAEVAAYADPDTGMLEAMARLAPNAGAFTDYREMLSADLCDAYVIAGPNDLHHPMLMASLPSNKPILCEKPLCTTIDDCHEVLSLAEARDAPVWVAMEYRFMPAAQQLIERVHRGVTGTPRMFAIREHRFPFLEKVDNWNRFSDRTGGTMIEKCCHFWDLMRLVLQSDPVRLYASAAMDVNHVDERYEGRMPDIIDNGFVVVDFANGTRGMLDLCMFAEGSHWQEVLTVTGDAARIEARIPGPPRFSAPERSHHAEIVTADRASRREKVEIVETDQTILDAGDHHGSTYYQHLRFFELVRSGGGTPEVTMEDGLWSVMMGEAAERSAREGRAIEL